MSNYKIGQNLWWVPRGNRRGNPHDVVITKIGKKWGYLNNSYRFDLKTMEVDGGDYSPPASIYLSQDVYHEINMIYAEWSDLKSKLAYSNPKKGVTVDDIKAAMKLLKLDEDK